MLSLTRPLGRIPFVLGLSLANSAILLVALIAFSFLPSGTGHIAVLVMMGALMAWWFALHARRFKGAGSSLAWPGGMAALAFGTFAVTYAVVAALFSVPEVQQAAFSTGGSDFTKHVETSQSLLILGSWIAGWVGAAGAIALAGFLAMLMGLVALLTGVVSFVALLLPTPRPPAKTDLFRAIPGMIRRG